MFQGFRTRPAALPGGRSCAARARILRPVGALAPAFAFTGLALTACSLGPAYHRPDPPAPSAWRNAAANGSWPASLWWQGFGSPQLDRLISQAQQANDDIADAIARVRQADAQVRITGAPLLPSLDATGSATREAQPLLVNKPLNTVTYDAFTAGLTAAYELDFWGKNRAARAAAVATANASRFDRQTVELSVLSSVANTYFSVLALEERLANARANLASAQKVLQGLRLQEQAGITTALDVAQQATVVETLSASIPPLEQSRSQTLDALAILLGELPEALELRGENLEGISRPPLTSGLAAELLTRRPDVAAAEAHLRAANADIRAARAAFFPSVNLTASGGYENIVTSRLFVPGSRVFQVGADLTQPIFRGGALLGQYRLSQAQYAQLLADYHKAVLTAFGNAEDALAAVSRTAEQLERQQAAVQAADHAYRMSQRQFHAGTVNILTVLNTENALFTAQDVLTQVKLAHLQALVGLYQALGGGWKI